MNREETRKFTKECQNDKTSTRNKFFYYLFSNKRMDREKIRSLIESDSFINKKFEQELFPKEIKSFNKIIYYYNDSLDLEETIMIAEWAIITYSKNIRRYLDLRLEYENCLFSLKFEEAKVLLNLIKNEVGLSIWLISQFFLVEEELNGYEGNKKLLNLFIEETNRNIVFSILIHYMSRQAEKSTSYLNYQESIKKFLKSLGDNKVFEYYFNYKLSLSKTFSYHTLSSILHFDLRNSLVDLYETYVDIVCREEFKSLIQFSRLDKINDLTDDYRVLRASAIFDYSDKVNCKSLLNLEDEYCSMVNSFDEGNYEEFFKINKHYLSRNSNDFSAYVTLSQAYLITGLEVTENIFLINDLINIFSLNRKYRESILNMFGYLKRFNNTSWNWNIYEILNYRKKISRQEELLSIFNDKRFGLKAHKFLINNKNEDILKEVKLKMNISYRIIVGKEIELHKNQIIRKVLNVKNFNYSGDIDEQIDVIKGVIFEAKNENYFIREQLIKLLVDSYIISKKFKELVIMFAKEYFINENILSAIDLNDIAEELLYNSELDTKKEILYPICIYIIDKANIKHQRIAFSNFIEANNINNINDLLSYEYKDINHYIHFLNEICTVEVLKRDYRLAKSTRIAEQYRLSILKHLMEINKLNTKIYQDEISEITIKSEINEKTRLINESRIFVDVEKIKRDYTSFINEDYNNYLLTLKFEEPINIIDVNSENLINELNNYYENINKRISNDANFKKDFEYLIGIIIRIMNEFLFNDKYGLDTFLSSRIRHGYLKNQLTKLFKEYNLLSKKKNDSSVIFNVNEYWDTVLEDCDSELTEKFKLNLSNFTNQIESKVSEVKDEWIKIKLKVNEKGLFDYMDFTNQYYYYLGLETKNNFDLFFSNVLDLLWIKTESNLDIIRNKINNDLLMSFKASLIDLELESQKLIHTDLNGHVRVLINNINQCKALITKDIIDFSNVFYRNDIEYLDFSFTDLVSTCKQISKKLYTDFDEIKFKTNIQSLNNVRGKFFPYFVDIINNLISNVIKHSGFIKMSEIDLKISINVLEDVTEIFEVTQGFENNGVKVVGNILKISMSNTISRDLDRNEVMKRTLGAFDKLNDPNMLKQLNQTEGGTGLTKICTTLKYSIGASYLVNFIVNEENTYMMNVHLLIDNLYTKKQEA